MQYIYLILFSILFSSDHGHGQAGKKDPALSKIVYSQAKKEINYYYKGSNNLRYRYFMGRSGLEMHMIKDNKLALACQSRKGNIYFRGSGIKSFIIMNPSNLKKVEGIILSWLANHYQDQQAMGSSPSMPDLGSSFDTGMDNLASSSDMFQSASDCKINVSCTCQSGTTISIQCDCGGVAYCQDKTATVCDTDEAGNETNCREVTNCTGGCSYN